MTLKNSFVTLLLAFLFGVAIMQPAPTHAEECNEEQIKEIEKDFDENAKKAMQVAVDSLKKYNDLVNQFESCGGKVVVGTPSFWSGDAIIAANEIDSSLGSSLGSADNYKYTGVVWSTATPLKCKSIAQQASAQLDTFKHAKKNVSPYLSVVRGKKEARACLCSEDNENKECLSYQEENAHASETKDGCYTFSEYMASMAVCPLCSIFEVILNTDSRVAHVAWEAVAEPLKSVVTVFFVVILAIETLKAVGALAGSSISSYLKTILIQGFKVAIVLILLSDSSYVYGYFVSPVIKGGLEMGEVFLQMGAENSGACQLSSSIGNFSDVEGSELDASLLGNILSTVRCFNNSAIIMPSVGRALICHGWANDGSFLPDFSMWFSGVVMYLFGLMIWLAISFYLIDCTVQLGMVCALVPLFIACWPFKMTKRYTNTGAKMILNTFFNYVLMGVVVLVGLEIISFALSGGDPESDMKHYMAILNMGNPKLEDLRKMGSLDGEGILILIACAIMSVKLIAIANGAANKFSAGSGSAIGAKMGGTAMSAGHKALHAGVGTAWTGAKAIGGAALDNTKIGRGIQKYGGKAVDTLVKKPLGAINRFATQTAPAWAGSKLSGGYLDKFQKRGTQGGGNKAPEQLDANAQENLNQLTGQEQAEPISADNNEGSGGS